MYGLRDIHRREAESEKDEGSFPTKKEQKSYILNLLKQDHE
jgi:hypothetical protein